MPVLKFSRVLCAVGFLVVLASNIWSISGWVEARGVYDDICYLRQAHLFERFGLGGLDTSITGDDDNYFANGLKQIGFPEWNVVSRYPCHTQFPRRTNMSCSIRREQASCCRCFPPAFR